MTQQAMWERYREQNPDAREYQAWSFGGDSDLLADLVRRGIKTATASAYPCYAADGEPLPAVGDYSVVLDSREEAVCVIRTTRVTVVPFSAVTEEHAWREGEDDRSLAAWRECHWKFFIQELGQIKQTFTVGMPVVCEEFELLYPTP